MDDGIRERHGVTATRQTGFVNVREAHDNIFVAVNDSNGSRECAVSPAEARYLASRLRRVARRLEERA